MNGQFICYLTANAFCCLTPIKLIEKCQCEKEIKFAMNLELNKN